MNASPTYLLSSRRPSDIQVCPAMTSESAIPLVPCPFPGRRTPSLGPPHQHAQSGNTSRRTSAVPIHLQGRRRAPDPHHLFNLVNSCALCPRGSSWRPLAPPPQRLHAGGMGATAHCPSLADAGGQRLLGCSGLDLQAPHSSTFFIASRRGFHENRQRGGQRRGVGCFRSGAHGPGGRAVYITPGNPVCSLLSPVDAWPGRWLSTGPFLLLFVSLSGLKSLLPTKRNSLTYFPFTDSVADNTCSPHCPNHTIRRSAHPLPHQLPSSTPRTIHCKTTTPASPYQPQFTPATCRGGAHGTSRSGPSTYGTRPSRRC